jgi:DNA-binding winged helix-turn-helix (wHTH) protein/tetratricopeptide (TPR) repeat protein
MSSLVTERHGLLTDFRLGEWLVKRDDGSLVSSQRVTRLEPLLMELLVFLCSHAGQVVSKNDVLRNVWGNRWVSDGTIKASFYQLRKALGDTPRKPRFIETLPKRGYRILIRPIALIKSADSAVPGEGADELYRNGRSVLSGQTGPATVKQARLYFEHAIKVQPEHAESLAALALTYIQLVTLAMAKGSEMLPQAKALAVRALEANPKLARAHVALGATQLLHERNLEDAATNFCLASNLDPSDTLSRRWYAKLLSNQGRHNEGIAEARRALEGEPLSLSVRRDLIEILLAARHYDETIAEAKRLVKMTGHAPDVQLGLVWVYFLRGDHEKAFQSLSAGFRSLGTRPEILDRAAKAFKSGGMETVLRLWAKVMEQQAALGQQSIDLLVLYGLLGERDRCFKLLDLAAKQFHPVILWLPVSPIFDKLRSDRRYDRLLSRLGMAAR